MSYYSKYRKYKEKYKMAQFSYLKNLKIINVKQYQIDIFSEYFPDLQNLDAIEFGAGNASKSIKLAELFNNYVAVEPNKILHSLAKKNCKNHDCSIKLINSNIENYNSNKKYDLIIFINTFHFIENIDLLKVINNNLKSYGIIYIEEPKPIPKGWGSPLLNISSPEFNEKKWNMKKNKLLEKKNFLMNNMEEYNVDYYDMAKNIFVISNK